MAYKRICGFEVRGIRISGELRDSARESLAHLEVPHRFTFVDELPKTATGKIQKYLLVVSESGGGKIECTMPKLIIKVNPSACVLAANCVGIDPGLFQIGQESYVRLRDASGILQGTEYAFEACDAELEMLEEAVESCPTRAISMQPAS